MKRLRMFVVASAAVFALMQLVPSGLHANVPKKPASQSPIPGNIHALLNRACMDCHSAEGKFPWYARVAPVSWLIARDVTKARAAMDLSDWQQRAQASPGHAMGLLVAACAGVQSKRMPPRPYQIMHSDAALNPQEATAFCSWTMQEMKRLKAQKPSKT